MLIQVLVPVGIMGGLAAVLAVMLVWASKKFYVFEDPKVTAVIEALPSANCGACGFAGCRSFAEELVKTKSADLYCPVGGSDVAKVLGDILGMTVEEREPQVARVKCNGTLAHATRAGLYSSVEDCRAAALIDGSPMACPFGCMGLGSCIRACDYDAITYRDGIVFIDETKCVGCGACVKTCPRSLIVIGPLSRRILVSCSSQDKGKAVKSACSVGCIACKRCVKACEFDALSMDGNVATIDFDKCTLCGVCMTTCPTGTILQYRDAAMQAEYVRPVECTVEVTPKEDKPKKAKKAADKEAKPAKAIAEGDAEEVKPAKAEAKEAAPAMATAAKAEAKPAEPKAEAKDAGSDAAPGKEPS